ncbi:MAG: hypothetical protein RL103_1698, partial [Pseudomonadota bacterium]
MQIAAVVSLSKASYRLMRCT